MAGRQRRSGELSGIAAVGLVAGTSLCGLLGYVYDNVMTGLLASLAGLTLTAFGFAVARAWSSHRHTQREQRAAPLPHNPAQALAVLSTRMKAADPSRLTSEVLATVERIVARAAQDSEAAARELESLADQHPHSPAIAAARADLAFAKGDESTGRAQLSRAVELAVRGGMGTWAARQVARHPDSVDRLDLTPSTRQLLDKILSRQSIPTATTGS
ncbi:MAG: hypothetical protein B7733_24475 [Myxococcales bacterium FL481]|nr:MAG: hypothetical protein B7733_24475 [Myxococcales bacterium FL481]